MTFFRFVLHSRRRFGILDLLARLLLGGRDGPTAQSRDLPTLGLAKARKNHRGVRWRHLLCLRRPHHGLLSLQSSLFDPQETVCQEGQEDGDL